MFKQLYVLLSLLSITIGAYAQKKLPDYLTLKTQLEEIYRKDQISRQRFLKVYKKDPKDSLYQKQLKEMIQTDEENLQKVTDLLDRYGWLPYSKVGQIAGDAQFLVIQHSNLKIMQKYFPQMRNLAAKGEASKYNVALMEDRILMNLGKKQVYGSQVKMQQAKGNKKARKYVWPIKDVSNVNKRRKKMGFSRSIEQQAKDMNAEFNPNEPLPKTVKK